jgi:hypothetical protein
MAYCVYCGTALKGAGSNCPNCTKASGKSANSKPQTKEVLFTDFKKDSKDKQIAAEKKSREIEKKKKEAARVARFKKNKKLAKDYIAKNKILVASVGSVAGALLLFGATQVTINLVNGPQIILNEYISAIQDGDWDALQDERLFPASTARAPEQIEQAFDTSSVANASFGNVWTDGNAGSAVISLNDDKDARYQVSIRSTPSSFFIFSVPNWKIASKAPQAILAFDEKVVGAHQVSFGKANPISVLELTESLNTEGMTHASVLPGVYKMQLEALGFYEENRISKTIWSVGNRQELALYPPDDQELSGWMTDLALSEANVQAQYCGEIICYALPAYSEYDFDLWSQYYYDEYTNSSFSYSASSGGCSLTSSEVTSHNSANLAFACDMSIYANLYVKYVYYYGYYSDYYYWWDFTDSTTTQIFPVVTLSITDAGDSVSVASSGF